jgi:hypothetical protein
MSEDNLFGELRSLLQRPPSRAAWDHLCLALEEWPAEALEQQALPYVTSILDRWPDALRVANPRWIKAFLRERKIPWLPLVRSVGFHGTRLTLEGMLKALDQLQSARLLELNLADAIELHVAEATALAAHPTLAQLRTIKLSNAYRSGEALVTLLSSPNLSALERLEVNGLHVDDPLREALTRLEQLGHQWLPSLRSLRIGWMYGGGDDQLREQRRIFPLGQLEKLELNYHGMDQQGLASLLEDTRWRALRTLRLPNTQLTANMVRTMQEHLPMELIETLTIDPIQNEQGAPLKQLMAGELDALRELELGAGKLNDVGLRALLERSPGKLEALQAPAAMVEEEGFEALMGSELGAGLRRLNISQLGTRAAHAARALAVAGPLPRLEELNMSSCELGQRGAMLLSRATLSGLRALTLDSSSLDAPGVEALLRAPWMAGVERLELQHSKLDATSMRSLMEHADSLRGLRRLNLSWCNLGPGGVMALARCQELGQLEELLLDGNNMGMSALQALLRAPWIGKLRVLKLQHNNLDDAALGALAQCAALWGLEELTVGEHNLTTRAGEEALDASPHLNTLAWPRKHAKEPLRRQRHSGPSTAVKPPTVRKRTK